MTVVELANGILKGLASDTKPSTYPAGTIFIDDVGAMSIYISGVWTVISSGGSATPDATTTVKGKVELATNGEVAALLVPQADDSRLSNARTPITHASTHKTGGADAIKLDELAAPTDIATLNSSTSIHGLLKKLSNSATDFMNGQGNWAVPGGVGSSITTIIADIFTEDFSSGTYSFSEGSTSPNGKWKNKFLSGGTGGVRTVSGNNVMWLTTPAVVADNLTASALNYITPNLFQDFELTLRMRTVSQTRTSPIGPQNWETAWIIWRTGDIIGSAQMGYYFTIKMSGCEFGKSDNFEGSISNYILVSTTPSPPSVTLGVWDDIKIRVEGNRHRCYVNNVLVIDYTDENPSAAPFPSRLIQEPGYISMYCEDANVEFDDINIVPIYTKSIINDPNVTPRPSSNRKQGSFYGTSPNTGSGLLAGAFATATGASNVRVVDNLGVHWSYTTGAVDGNQCGLSTSLPLFRRSHNPILKGKFKMPASTAANYFWFGFSSSPTLAHSIDPLNNLHGMIVGFRADTGLWGVIGNNASASDSVVVEGLGTAAGQWVYITLDIQSSPRCIIKLQNRTPIVITSTVAKPGATADMYLHAIMGTTTGAKTLIIDYIDIEISPGVET